MVNGRRWMQALRVSDQWIELQDKLVEDRRERFRPVGIDPGWDYNPGAAHVRRAQQGLIAKLESRQLEIGRAVVRHNLDTGDFRHFV